MSGFNKKWLVSTKNALDVTKVNM